jgi:hypothetical protein
MANNGTAGSFFPVAKDTSWTKQTDDKSMEEEWEEQHDEVCRTPGRG